MVQVGKEWAGVASWCVRSVQGQEGVQFRLSTARLVCKTRCMECLVMTLCSGGLHGGFSGDCKELVHKEGKIVGADRVAG